MTTSRILLPMYLMPTHTLFGDFDIKSINEFHTFDRKLKMVFRNLLENNTDESTITNVQSTTVLAP